MSQYENNPVLESAHRILSDLANPQDILKAKGDEWRQTLWNALEHAGLPLAWVPESLGGIGLSLDEVMGVMRIAGKFALPVPLADTMVAGWIAAQAGFEPLAGKAALAIHDVKAEVEGDLWEVSAKGVPFAMEADWLLVIFKDGGNARIAAFNMREGQVTPYLQPSGEAAGNVSLKDVPVAFAQAEENLHERALSLAATCRSFQIAGALEAMLDISVAYAKERVAFEKTISKFQAVQQNLARLGGEVAAALAASESAANTLCTTTDPDVVLLEVGAAKVRCGEAAETGSAIAHQVMGAIGYTEEHVLHRYSLRAMSWRDDFGDEVFWSQRLGELIQKNDSSAFWQLLSSR